MLTVDSTLKEMVLLWVQNFWYLVLISIPADIPGIVFHYMGDEHYRTHSPGLLTLKLGVALIAAFFGAVKAAVILGLLKKRAPDVTVWAAIAGRLGLYSWTLFKLHLLIVLSVALIIMAIIGLILAIQVGAAIALVMGACFLVLIKFALAYPLVVAEGMSATDALLVSWEMTKEHFWYVLGNYLLLGLSAGIVKWFILSSSITSVYWLWVPAHMFVEVIECMWIILPWCMYLRIVESHISQGRGLGDFRRF